MTKPRNPNKGAHGNPRRHNPMPRKSSPDGIEARAEYRVKTFRPGDGDHKPGSRNPHKVGR